MKRKFYDTLLKWKREQGKTALLIDGARRVGKSFIAQEFGKNEYKSVVYIDFNIQDKNVVGFFENYIADLDSFFLYISNYFSVELYERDTLFIFDEVQMCPRARAAIKYLVADGRYDYLETGSLVSINQNVQGIVIPSEERYEHMFPMDFEEFLWALGDETSFPAIRLFFEKKKPLGQALHRKFFDLFKLYMIVGGMPQAVLEYANTKNFEKTDRIKRDILQLYRSDIAKHAKKQTLKANAIFDELPAQLQKHEKKFTLAAIRKNARFREYESAFMWLADARIVLPAYNTTAPNFGLKLNMDRLTQKLYMADTGLLISHSFDEKNIVSEEIYKKILLGKLEFNSGMLMENIVAQSLHAAGHKLYFYSQNSPNAEDRMEIDFLISKSKITTRHNISAIEVKSSARYSLRSLQKFMPKYAEQLDRAIVLHTADLKKADNVLYLPVYMASLL